ncbi:MAG: ABC transporter ATP-binding protein [Syntrophales bacterium]|nr:ABC transporter ATP-binding protein [Syntrophales bacterium]
MLENEVLRIVNLKTWFETPRGTVRAVDGVDLSLERGKTLGVVGESGCGKTVLALSILKLVPRPAGRIVSGRILLNGMDLLAMSDEEMRRVRGRCISMIFQEPMTALNPVLRIGEQVSEVVRLHQGLSRKDALERTVEMLGKVGIPSPEKRVRDYPHQLSGGMRQRVMIAMALSCNPSLLLADEPTTALDVTIQAQILELIRRIQEDTGTSVMIITHDLGVISEAAHSVAVMYAGKIVEYAAAEIIFSRPLHPYTTGLLKSIPSLEERDEKEYLEAIPGAVPSLFELPAGCSYQDRCPEVEPACRVEPQELRECSPGHFVRCWKERERKG